METKEPDSVRVIYIPSIGTVGLVLYDCEESMTILSTNDNLFTGDRILVVNLVVKDSSLERSFYLNCGTRDKLISDILNDKFTVSYFRKVCGGKLSYEVLLSDPSFDYYLRKAKYFINTKRRDKNMKTKEIFIPYYLEYVGTYLINWLGGFEGLLFKKVDGSYVFAYNIGKSRVIHCREFEDDSFFTKTTGSDLVREVGKVIMSGDFSDIEFKLFNGLEGMNVLVDKSEKDRYLVTILNCLDINFSHKSMVTDEVVENWKFLREIDKVRSNELNEPGLLNPMAVDEGIFSVNRIAIYGDSGLSDKIYEHFKNYKMKDKMNIEKVKCIRDIEDGIDFAKLDVREKNYGGDFDLVGLKGNGDEEYSLVIREVSKNDLNTCKYRSLTNDEKIDFLIKLVDQDTNITSTLIQGNDGKIWENTETNDVDGYRDYIEAVVDKVIDGEECSLHEDAECSKDFVCVILDMVDRIKNKLSSVENKIDYDSSRPIMYNLMSISKCLDNLKSKD
jgi:hypothetical protein